VYSRGRERCKQTVIQSPCKHSPLQSVSGARVIRRRTACHRRTLRLTGVIRSSPAQARRASVDRCPNCPPKFLSAQVVEPVVGCLLSSSRATTYRRISWWNIPVSAAWIRTATAPVSHSIARPSSARSTTADPRSAASSNEGVAFAERYSFGTACFATPTCHVIRDKRGRLAPAGHRDVDTKNERTPKRAARIKGRTG
jgi:hypothetical protein